MTREENKVEFFVPQKHLRSYFEKDKFYLMYDDKGQFSMKDSWVVGIFGSHKNNSLFSAGTAVNDDFVCNNILTAKGDFFKPETCVLLDDVFSAVEILKAREVRHCGDLDKLKFNEIFFRFLNSPIYSLIDSSMFLINGVRDVDQQIVDGEIIWHPNCYSTEFLVKDIEAGEEEMNKVTDYLQTFYDKERGKVKTLAMKHLISKELSCAHPINYGSIDKMNDRVAEIMNL